MPVCRRSQTAGRNSCSIVSGDVSNGSYRQFGLAIFLYTKTIQNLGEIGWLARVVYFNDPATGYECQRSGPSRVGANESSANLYGGVCVCSRMRVRACVGMRACVRDV